MLNISEHITYADAIRSDTAKREGINNYFTPDQLARLKVLAENIYEPVVQKFGKPIYISSFFRNEELNRLIGGVYNSQHLANNGAAIDLDADNTLGVTNKQVFEFIRKKLDFDQLILEDIREDGSIGWVHCSYVSKEKNRHQVLKMVKKDGVSTYENY